MPRSLLTPLAAFSVALAWSGGWIAGKLGEAGTPQWNFHTYLIGPDGELAGAQPS